MVRVSYEFGGYELVIGEQSGAKQKNEFIAMVVEIRREVDHIQLLFATSSHWHGCWLETNAPIKKEK